MKKRWGGSGTWFVLRMREEVDGRLGRERKPCLIPLMVTDMDGVRLLTTLVRLTSFKVGKVRCRQIGRQSYFLACSVVAVVIRSWVELGQWSDSAIW